MDAVTPPLFIGAEITNQLSWQGAVRAIKDGHKRPRPQLGDTLLKTQTGELLTRSATIAGYGAGVKAATIIAGNPSKAAAHPAVQGAFFLFDDHTGVLKAIIDGAALTHWKTVADSLAGASILARPAPRALTVFGTGFMASALIEGYQAYFPSLEKILIWGRSQEKAEKLAARHNNAECIVDPIEALGVADIITSATASKSPIISGDAIKQGAHVDLVGAHGPNMREADDALMARARLFVDCNETTIDHIGEITIPISKGIITRNYIKGDLYDLCAGDIAPRTDDDVTVFKNGGGAHLDLMIARYIVDVQNLAPPPACDTDLC